MFIQGAGTAERTYDAIVVGSGISGGWAAKELTEKGLRTLVLERGRAGQVNNIGGGAEHTNLAIVKQILALLQKDEGLIQFVQDRPGHDRRYAIDSTKLRTELGWAPERTFDAGLAETVRWFLEHRTWWERVVTGDYRQYYDLQYSSRLTAME